MNLPMHCSCASLAPIHVPCAYNACNHEREEMRREMTCTIWGLGKAKVFTTSGHGGVEGLAEVFVRFVLGEIEFYNHVSVCRVNKEG